ncbi:MAG TPA: hypothetical protein VIS99_15670 [Terrimicrobiaceae bacterium]
MTAEEFRDRQSEPADSAAPLRAMWYEGRGDWERAHQIAQGDESRESAWVHAYLHRREGDVSNARYWYTRAGKPAHHGALDDEWKEIVNALLPSTDS